MKQKMNHKKRLFPAVCLLLILTGCAGNITKNSLKEKLTPDYHTYKKVNNLEIKLSVYPPETGSINSPVIVLLHGGALINGSRFMYKPDDPANKLFFELGATVITVDYRLAPETKLPEIIKDIQDCFKWIYSEGKNIYQYDTDNIIVAGHSAGGYLTMMCGFCLEKPPKALITYYGYGDITKDWYTKPDAFYRTKKLEDEPKWWFKNKETACSYKGRGTGAIYLYYRQNGLWTKGVSGVDPKKNPKFFDQYEPIKNISKNYPPILMLHGDKDTDVPYEKSVDMSKELTKFGVENQLITIKNGPHGFDIKQVDTEQVKHATIKVKEFIRDIFNRKNITIP